MANTIPENFEKFMSLCDKYGFHALHDALFSEPEEYLDSNGFLKEEFDYPVKVISHLDLDAESSFANAFNLDINLLISPNWPALEALIAENAMKRSFASK